MGGVLDYKTIDKTGWFIQHLKSGSFSRQEIIAIAAKEFPTIPLKTLDGTIGQYWSDSVNPKWGTYKAIQARGLTVVENAGKRRIMENGGTVTPPAVNSWNSIVQPYPAAVKPVAEMQCQSDGTREMWNSNDLDLWQTALTRYWTFVKASNLELEKEMDRFDVETVKAMKPKAWFELLLEKYFRWKYTAPNRYGSTTKSLRTYAANNELAALHAIKERLFAMDKDHIQQCLPVASSIRGLGTAGASGLLAILFPAQFGTVDQFVVKALAKIPELPEKHLIAAMVPESLKLTEGTILIRIMRRKAEELNRASSLIKWTPRKVDMVLWTCAR
jgi:hypothetical protein